MLGLQLTLLIVFTWCGSELRRLLVEGVSQFHVVLVGHDGRAQIGTSLIVPVSLVCLHQIEALNIFFVPRAYLR